MLRVIDTYTPYVTCNIYLHTYLHSYTEGGLGRGLVTMLN